jgi:hypothetical protein
MQRMGRLGRSTTKIATFYIFTPKKKTLLKLINEPEEAGESRTNPIVVQEEDAIKVEQKDDDLLLAPATAAALPPQDTDTFHDPPADATGRESPDIDGTSQGPSTQLKKKNTVKDEARKRNELEVIRLLMGKGCLREATNMHYTNPKISEYKCSCRRCLGLSSCDCPGCCSACTESLTDPPGELIEIFATKQPKPLDSKAHIFTDEELNVVEILQGWARQVAKETLRFVYAGSSTVMNLELAKHFVFLHQTGHLRNPAELRQQTQWGWADQFGEVVMEMLSRHLPPAENDAAGEAAIKQAGPSTENTKTEDKVKRSNKCSNCRKENHNRESRWSFVWLTLCNDFSPSLQGAVWTMRKHCTQA